MRRLCHPLTSSQDVHGGCGKQRLKPQLLASNVLNFAQISRILLPEVLPEKSEKRLMCPFSLMMVPTRPARRAHFPDVFGTAKDLKNER